MRTQARRVAGVSLIEALVAMAVMAFGMLAVVGMQATLRSNADASRQRAEAVRFAQEQMEKIRTFSVLDTPTSPIATMRSFDGDVVSGAMDTNSLSISGYNANATFSGASSVTSSPAGTTTFDPLLYMPQTKQILLNVSWTDRNDEAQSVQLMSLVSRSAPEISGALSVAAIDSAASTLNFRNPGIPPGATNLQGTERGYSGFTPPGSTEYWKFNNSTGLIVQICRVVANCPTLNGSQNPLPVAALLAGYVRYAISGANEPTSDESETPPDLGMPSGITVGVVVHTPSFAQPAPVICYISPNTLDLGAYYCAVPVPNTPPFVWSGRSTVTLNGCWDRTTHNDSTDPLATPPHYDPDPNSPVKCTSASPFLLASSVADATSSLYRICRYSTRRDQSVVTSGPPPFTNIEHPLDYLNVATPLTNQNFLVIRAGGASGAYGCPDDNSTTPLVGNTWHHQPPY